MLLIVYLPIAKKPCKKSLVEENVAETDEGQSIAVSTGQLIQTVQVLASRAQSCRKLYAGCCRDGKPTSYS